MPSPIKLPTGPSSPAIIFCIFFNCQEGAHFLWASALTWVFGEHILTEHINIRMTKAPMLFADDIVQRLMGFQAIASVKLNHIRNHPCHPSLNIVFLLAVWLFQGLPGDMFLKCMCLYPFEVQIAYTFIFLQGTFVFFLAKTPINSK